MTSSICEQLAYANAKSKTKTKPIQPHGMENLSESVIIVYGTEKTTKPKKK